MTLDSHKWTNYIYAMPTILVPDQSFQLRTGEPADLPYVMDLHRRHSNALGFIPRAGLEQKLNDRQIVLLSLRGQAAAYYCISGGRRVPVHGLQNAVEDCLWRQGYGSLLWSAVALVTTAAPRPDFRFRVRSQLPANLFWHELGADLVDVRPGGKARAQDLNCYHFTPAAVHAASDPIRELITQHDPRVNLQSPFQRN